MSKPSPASVFGEFDLESESLDESVDGSSYAPLESEISALRPPPPVIEDEPLRESREPFRAALRATTPDTEPRVSALPANIEEALTRAARSSFASQPPAVDRPSGVRVSAPSSIEEAVLRAVESLEPVELAELPELAGRTIPKA